MSSVLAETLIAAKSLGIDSSKLVVSRKLQWTVQDGKTALCKASFDRSSGRVTLYADAIRARDENVIDVLKEVVSRFNPNHKPGGSSEGGEFAEGDGGGSESDSEPLSPKENKGLAPVWSKIKDKEELKVMKETLVDWSANLYRKVNEGLRTGKWKDKRSKEAAEILDNIFVKAGHNMPRDALLYRRMSGEKIKFKVGSKIKDKSFNSTSSSKKLFTHMSEGVLMHITVPKGSRVFSVVGGDNDAEKEILLPRNPKYEVTKVIPPKDKYSPTIVHARYLG